MGVILVFSTAMARPSARNHGQNRPVARQVAVAGDQVAPKFDACAPNLQQSITMSGNASAAPQHSVIIR
jgi:hypothetical protein